MPHHDTRSHGFDGDRHHWKKLRVAVARLRRGNRLRLKTGVGVKSFRILHVDDDPLMRDVVELALGFDPEFVVMSCAGGEEALAASARLGSPN